MAYFVILQMIGRHKDFAVCLTKDENSVWLKMLLVYIDNFDNIQC